MEQICQWKHERETLLNGVIPTFALQKYPLGMPFDAFDPAVKTI